MDTRTFIMLATEMEGEMELATATCKAAQSQLQIACMKGDAQQIEDARVKAIETFSAHVDVTIKWAKKIQDARITNG